MEENIKNLIYTLEMHHISSEPIINLINRNKELEEKNKKAIEYINKNCSTYNCDYMDAGIGNLFKDILELLEERN